MNETEAREHLWRTTLIVVAAMASTAAVIYLYVAGPSETEELRIRLETFACAMWLAMGDALRVRARHERVRRESQRPPRP